MWDHFSNNELKCQCNYDCGLTESDMAPKIMVPLVKIRKDRGFAIPVNSACRCPRHNNDESKTGYSGPHTPQEDGMCYALDLGVSRQQGLMIMTDFAYLNKVEELHGRPWIITGWGFRQRGNSRILHLDATVGPKRPALWTY